MRGRTTTLILLCSFFVITLQSQDVYIRGYVGQTFYQGDLSPTTSAFSFSQGHAALSFYAGTNVTEALTLGTKFTKAHISGYDDDSFYKWKLERNLHFESPLHEFGIVTELYLNKVFKGLDKFNLNIYLTSGVSVFRFEPRAYLDGEIIDLPELSTEGQGLAQYPDSRPYSQTQISIPLGIGFSFNIADNFQIGFEVAPRMTFTDYLDDVSSYYVDPSILLQERGLVAAQLSNRTWELINNDNSVAIEGRQRGNPDNNDWYLYTGIHFGYVISNKKVTKKQRPNRPKS